MASTSVTDDRGNRCSVQYFGSKKAAQKALDSLKNCDDCTNCSDCSDCSRCSDCSYIARRVGKRDIQADPDPDANASAGPPPVQVIENIDQTVFAAASRPQSLEMSIWHTCEKTHCWAGWVVTLAGVEGKALEKFFNTPLAAMKILDASSPLRVSLVRFFEANKDALREMKKLADQEAAQ
jgi:hypothetical protein